MRESSEPQQMSRLLSRACAGSKGALAEVFQRAYGELRALASARLRSRGQGCALETTALVHETFVRFAQRGEFHVEDRTHFFRYAGRVMRSVIVDGVRERCAQRRGHG